MLSTTMLDLFFPTSTCTESGASPLVRLVLWSTASLFASLGLDLSPFSIALVRLNAEDLDAAFATVVSMDTSSMVASLDASSS